MDSKNHAAFAYVFILFFLLLTPLGLFNDWIPPTWNKGFYFITATEEQKDGGYYVDTTWVSPLLHKGYYSVIQIDEGDDAGYYAYLRSAFFDGDIDFINELNYIHADKFNDTGYVFNNWQIGQSILFLPFFLAGHVHAMVLNGLGYPVAIDGYSEPYYLWTAIATQTYVFLGLFLLYRILRKYYNPGPAFWAALVSWIATPIVYYTFIRQRMAHGTEFFLSVLFLAFWLHYRYSKELRHHALMGAVLGFLCMARLVAASYFFLYFVDLIFQQIANREEAISVKLNAVLLRLASFLSLLFIVFLPQFYVWNQIDGSVITYLLSIFKLIKGHTGSVESSLGILDQFKVFFFTGNWALSLSAPLWFLALIAVLIWPPLPNRETRFGVMAFFLVLILILLTTGEQAGAAYGSRYLTLASPLFAFGLAAVLNKASSRSWLFWSFAVFGVFCIFLQYMLIVQYKVLLDYNDPNFIIKALGAIPTLLLNHPELLLRSTNWVRIFFLDESKIWDYHDFLFLAVFPLLQIFCVLMILHFAPSLSRRWKVWDRKVEEKSLLGFTIFVSLTLFILTVVLAPSKTEQDKRERQEFARLMEKSNTLVSKGKYDEAISVLKKASHLQPDTWMPLYKLGWAYEKKKDLHLANQYYRELLVKNPYHHLSLYNLGDNLNSLGKYDEAKVYLAAARKRNPGNIDVYNALGVNYAKQNIFDKAREMFKTTVFIKPNFGIAHFNLALLESVANNPEEAKAHLKKAIQLGVKSPMIPKLSKLYKLDKKGRGGR